MNLEAELAKERESYIQIESCIRQLMGKKIRGLPIIPDDQEVQGHLDACRSYYELYGTKLGYNSPWIVAYNDPNHFSQVEHRRRQSGKKE